MITFHNTDDSRIQLVSYQENGIFYVEFWLNGDYSKRMEFETEAEQRAFIADPFK